MPSALNEKPNNRCRNEFRMGKSRQINLLVEEHDIGLPDFVWGKTEHADASVVSLVPLQLIILPHLER